MSTGQSLHNLRMSANLFMPQLNFPPNHKMVQIVCDCCCFLVTVVAQKVVIFSEWINKAAGWKQQLVTEVWCRWVWRGPFQPNRGCCRCKKHLDVVVSTWRYLTNDKRRTSENNYSVLPGTTSNPQNNPLFIIQLSYKTITIIKHYIISLWGRWSTELVLSRAFLQGAQQHYTVGGKSHVQIGSGSAPVLTCWTAVLWMVQILLKQFSVWRVKDL